MNKLSTMSVALVTAFGLSACGGSSGGDDDAPAAPVRVGDTILLTASGQLASIDRATPGTLVGTVPVRGLTAGETLIGIDHRAADGVLYGLGSAGRLYTLDASTGAATLKATLRAATGDDAPFAALDGTAFAVDFNPVADRLRVISNTGQNLRINVDTGDAITDGPVASTAGAATITAAGYTNAFAGTTSTALYDIDPRSGLLFLQDPPNAGTLATPVSLGVSGLTSASFDIDARSQRGYAVMGNDGAATLYTVDLAATSNAATRVGELAVREPVRGIALVQPAAPTVVGLTADNRLVGFDPRTPTTLTGNVAVSGLAGGERLVGIDVRPADRVLYGLTQTGRLVTIDPQTGVATPRATLVADAADASAPYAGLVGTTFSVDFNPVADRLRVLGDTGQSLRINVDTGATTTDGTINRASAPASVVAAAYTNAFAGTTRTTLFDLDTNLDVLARQDPPNDGTLVDIGALGVNLGTSAAFDIAGGGNGLVLAGLPSSPTGPTLLYSVSLTTGAATLARGTEAAASTIGGPGGPALIDLAIRF